MGYLKFASRISCMMAFLSPSFVYAASISFDPSYPYYITHDGQIMSVDFGMDDNNLAYINTPDGGKITLGDFAGGGDHSYVYDVSDDLNKAVGYGSTASNMIGFIWENGVGLTPLGTIAGYNDSEGVQISPNGNIVLGNAFMNFFVRGVDSQAFLWSGGVITPLGLISGGSFSEANAMTSDGSVVVGYADDGVFGQAFRWTQATGVMVGLGRLSGSNWSEALGVSGNGKVVVGYSEYPSTGGEGFVWNEDTGLMIGVGFLPDSTISSASLVDYSGTNVFGSSHSASGGGSAFRWREDTGIIGIADILSTAGIDISAYYLEDVTSINDTGNLITGVALELDSGDSFYYLANLSTAGFITEEKLAESIASINVPVHATQNALSQISQSLYAARLNSSWGNDFSMKRQTIDTSSIFDIAPAAGASPSRLSVYLVGNLLRGQGNDLSNWGVDGTVGIKMAVNDKWVIGAGLNGSETMTGGHLGSKTTLLSKGGSVLSSYVGDEGVRFYSSLFFADLNAKITRGYMNGANIDYSKSQSDGYAYGGAVRLGWAFDYRPDTEITPFIEVQAAKIEVDSYHETGGAFPLAFSKQDSFSTIGKIGAIVEHEYSPKLTLSTQLAYVHAPKSKNSSASVSLAGASYLLPEHDIGDQNWVEGSIGFEYDVTSDLSFAAELSGRTGNNVFPQMGIAFGVSYKF